MACSFMKRQASDCDWDDVIPTAVEGMLQETKSSVDTKDPGLWCVS